MPALRNHKTLTGGSSEYVFLAADAERADAEKQVVPAPPPHCRGPERWRPGRFSVKQEHWVPDTEVHVAENRRAWRRSSQPAVLPISASPGSPCTEPKLCLLPDSLHTFSVATQRSSVWIDPGRESCDPENHDGRYLYSALKEASKGFLWNP